MIEMGKALFRRSDSLYVRKYTNEGSIPHDSSTHIAIDVSEMPDARLHRWDGATGVRVATQPETSDLDETAFENESVAKVNTPINKTIRDLLMDIEVRLRAAGQTSSIPDIAAASNKSEYQTALKEILKIYS